MINISENRIKEQAEKHLLRCRPGDWNHAQRVVHWVKKLGKDREDILLIITAGYIHDIGWEGLITKEKITLDELLTLENSANSNSKLFATNFLRSFDFSSENIDTVNRLIYAADQHQSSRDDEEIIVDADSLSKLTIDHLKEKFEKKEWMKMYDLWAGKFLERVKTEETKLLYPTLLADLKISIDKEIAIPNIYSKNNTQKENEVIEIVKNLYGKYNIPTFTHEIIIEEGSVPHSHPILTLNIHTNDERIILKTLVHEQLHWYTQNHKNYKDCISYLKTKYEDDGEHNKSGTYPNSYWEHIIVCFNTRNYLINILSEKDIDWIYEQWQAYPILEKLIQEKSEEIEDDLKKFDIILLARNM